MDELGGAGAGVGVGAARARSRAVAAVAPDPVGGVTPSWMSTYPSLQLQLQLSQPALSGNLRRNAPTSVLEPEVELTKPVLDVPTVKAAAQRDIEKPSASPVSIQTVDLIGNGARNLLLGSNVWEGNRSTSPSHATLTACSLVSITISFSTIAILIIQAPPKITGRQLLSNSNDTDSIEPFKITGLTIACGSLFAWVWLCLMLAHCFKCLLHDPGSHLALRNGQVVRVNVLSRERQRQRKPRCFCKTRRKPSKTKISPLRSFPGSSLHYS